MLKVLCSCAKGYVFVCTACVFYAQGLVFMYIARSCIHVYCMLHVYSTLKVLYLMLYVCCMYILCTRYSLPRPRPSTRSFFCTSARERGLEGKLRGTQVNRG